MTEFRGTNVKISNTSTSTPTLRRLGPRRVTTVQSGAKRRDTFNFGSFITDGPGGEGVMSYPGSTS